MVIAATGPADLELGSGRAGMRPPPELGSPHLADATFDPIIEIVAPTGERSATDDVVRDLLAAQELERRRIARDLHDVVGQALTAVKLSLEAQRRNHDTRTGDAELRRSIAIVDQAMRDVRDIAFDLRPAILDDLGLVAATRWYLSRQARIGGYRSTLRADAIRREVGVEIESACFRTLQEALTNVARHARATRVKVELRQAGDELILVVEDDGVGFCPRTTRRPVGRRPTLGLIGASERANLVGGSLDVASRPGEGTRITARFPRRCPTTALEGRG